MNSFLVAKEVETSKAINTDWFSSNISAPVGTAQTGKMYKHTLMIHCPTSTIVKVLYDYDGSTNIDMNLNSGTALAAGAVYVFDILLPVGASYNIQHETTTQNITCIIAQTDTGMIG